MKVNLDKTLSEIFGEPVKVEFSSSVGGGCINETQALTLSNKKQVFLKYNAHPPDQFFIKEARGLNLLGTAANGPKIPQPLSNAHPNFLILEFVKEQSPKEGFFETFGRAMATMHRTGRTHYGLDHDNFIGTTVQQNTQEEDPIVFFREHRLKFQQDLARKRGLLSDRINRKLDMLCDRLGELIDVTGEKPALSHGDLWSGNYFCGPHQEPYIFDPAVYFGLREADLAMTELFGQLPKRFYDAYREAFPLNPGYEDRKKIFNLYHLLNHVNLFGRSYLSSVENTLNHFVE